MTEFEFAKKIHALGGKAYLVGGAVRDKFRGVKAHDRDYCITGIDEKIFTEAFPKAIYFGKSFPVYSLEINGKFCEVAFARIERKISTGYRGFEVIFTPNVTIEQDLFRRDTTMNAMAVELLSGALVDPIGGRQDILNKKIRAVSEHFIEDPVRALRAARQAAQFDFEICDETIEAMNFCGVELADEPAERIFNELEISLTTDRPSIFFRSLERADLLKIIFPEIADLRGKIQPMAYHPEGDAYEHTLQIVDAVAAVNPKPIVRFSALMHDIGKSVTPLAMLPHHYLHEYRGLDVLNRMACRLKLPSDWKKNAAFVIREHMRAAQLSRPGKIVDLLMRLHKSRIELKDFCDIINADNHGLPSYLKNAKYIVNELLKIGGKDAPNEFSGASIGKWIRAARIKRFIEICAKEN